MNHRQTTENSSAYSPIILSMAPFRSFLSVVALVNYMNAIMLSAVDALHMAPFPPFKYPCPNPRILISPTSNPLYSTNLLGRNQKGNSRNCLLHGELFSTHGNGHDTTRNNSKSVDAEMAAESTTSSSTPTSFLRAVDNFGLKLKPWALSAYQRSLTYSNIANVINDGEEGSTSEKETTTSMKRTSNFKSILCRIQSNVFWLLYILYRGYRGFFVILPAVFRAVYAQLNDSDLVVDIYGDEEMEEREYAVNANATSQKEQLQQPMKLRTRITISILSGILTLSYVVSGALRVLGECLLL